MDLCDLTKLVEPPDEGRMKQQRVQGINDLDLRTDKITGDLTQDPNTPPISRILGQMHASAIVVDARFTNRIRPKATKNTEESDRRSCKNAADQIARSANLKNGPADNHRRSRVSKFWRDC